MLTGQPCIQLGFGQSKQRFASSNACSAVKPWFTSSELWLRYSPSSSFILTRAISVRSLFFIDLRSSSRQAALLSVKFSISKQLF